MIALGLACRLDENLSDLRDVRSLEKRRIEASAATHRLAIYRRATLQRRVEPLRQVRKRALECREMQATNQTSSKRVGFLPIDVAKGDPGPFCQFHLDESERRVPLSAVMSCGW